MKKIGYTTGTFSDIHPGQIEFLKACKKFLGDDQGILIVGLVTDELAVKQKRRASMTYRHRRAILQEFPFVDLVVSHHGDTKLKAHQKFNFDYVFIGEEYFGSQEYEDIAKLGVKVIYIPCPMAREFSSSALAAERVEYITKQLKIIKCGTSGLVYLMDEKPAPIIIKTVRISHREAIAPRSENVFGMPLPPPRNFKETGTVHRFCNLPGVSGYRELDIIPFITGKPWCPIIQTQLVFSTPHSAAPPPLPTDPGDWSFVHAEKSNAQEIYFIYQNFRGNTLTHWLSQWENPARQLQVVINEIHRIIFEDLIPAGIVHGDIHADNICVEHVTRVGPQPVLPGGRQPEEDKELRLSLVDWGWCIHRSFPLSPEERTDYQEQLRTAWDWTHFTKSIKYSFQDRPWYPQISLPE